MDPAVPLMESKRNNMRKRMRWILGVVGSPSGRGVYIDKYNTRSGTNIVKRDIFCNALLKQRI